MDLTTLKAHIKNKKFDPYYIFTGEDCGVQRVYINQIAKVRNASVKILNSIQDLGVKNHMYTSFSNSSVCVLYDDKDFLSNDKMEAFITQNIASESVLIIFVYTSIDKRTKFFKSHQDRIVDFPHLKSEVLVKYVQKEVDLSDSMAKKLIDACECDYSRILIEVDKLRTYADVVNRPYDECLRYLFAQKLIYMPPKDAVFDFVDMVLRDNRKLALELLQESYASGEATLVLLTNLYNATKQLFQVQSYKGSSKLTDVTGLTPFQVKLASMRRGYNSLPELVYLMRLIRTVEKGIKTGEIEDFMAVEYILIKHWESKNTTCN